MLTTPETTKQSLNVSWPLNVNVWLHGDSLERPNWDLLSKTLKYSMHPITYEIKRKKGKPPVVVWSILKAVTFHTDAGLWVVFSLSTHYFKTNFLSFCFSMLTPIDTGSIKEKTLKKRFLLAYREDKTSLSSLTLHSSHLWHSRQAFAPPFLHESSTQHARKYYPGKADAFQN